MKNSTNNVKNLLIKEIKLASNPITFFFIAFGLMAMIPGYPISLGAFFVCLGIFQSFQYSRENNDILYTLLLPVRKADVVKSKYIFVVFVQMSSFILMFILTLIRMTVLKSATPYVTNPMMNANQTFLAVVLVIFALFNVIFVRGYFVTAYKFAKPFIAFIIVSFVVITMAEALHHFPNMDFLNSTDTMSDIRQWGILIVGIVFYVLTLIISEKQAEKLFEKVDM